MRFNFQRKGFFCLFSFPLILSLSLSLPLPLWRSWRCALPFYHCPSLSPKLRLLFNHWGPGQTSQHEITFSFPISFNLPSSDGLRIIHVYI
ncbi:hypothetical protein I7I48_08766 [Histoplasma ohiense]|nr:hypothetical protein I7I48_08766 [Histoplasma ohiense (nom. inval.)]